MKICSSHACGVVCVGALLMCQLAVVQSARAQSRPDGAAAVTKPAAIVAPVEPALSAPTQGAVVTATSALPVVDTLGGGMTQKMVLPVIGERLTGGVPLERAAARGTNRPRALIPLYLSMTALQALDVVSTRRALGTGNREANPLVAGLVKSPGALLAVKAGASGALIYACERLWKQNRAAAVLVLIGTNIAYGAVVSHNFAIAAHAPGTR